MGQLEFFRYVDEVLVVLETENVKEAIKRCYVEAVNDSTFGTPTQTNSVTIHEMVEDLPECDSIGIIFLSTKDNGIYQCNSAGIPVFIQTFSPGMHGVLIGRDFDLSNLIFATRQFSAKPLLTAFDEDAMSAIKALQWGENTLIIRSSETSSDIISFNNLDLDDYDIDRYIPKSFSTLESSSAAVFKNRLFVSGLVGEAIKLVKLEQNSLSETEYFGSSLPVGLSKIDNIFATPNLLFIIQNTVGEAAKKWFSFDLQKFTNVTPDADNMTIIDVIPFNDGYLFIGANSTHNIIAYHYTTEFSELFTIDIPFEKYDAKNKFATDGKRIYYTVSGTNNYYIVDSSYAVEAKQIEDTFYIAPFASSGRVYAIANQLGSGSGSASSGSASGSGSQIDEDGIAYLYKSNPITGELEKIHTINIDGSESIESLAFTSGVGINDDVIITNNAIVNLLEKKTNIIVK